MVVRLPSTVREAAVAATSGMVSVDGAASPAECDSTPGCCSLRGLVVAAALEGGREWRRVRRSGFLVVEGTLLQPQLQPTNEIGRGSHCRVYQVRLTDVPFPVCFKVMNVENAALESLLQECGHLVQLEDVAGLPRVVAFSLRPRGFLMTQHGGRACTIKSWLSAPSPPPEKLIVAALYQLCNILQQVHRYSLCHNSIKMANVSVVVAPGGRVEVTLLDAGRMLPYGSYPWSAKYRDSKVPLPENYAHRRDIDVVRRRRPCSEAADVYQVGCLLRELSPLLSVTRCLISHFADRATGTLAERPSMLSLMIWTHHALRQLLPSLPPFQAPAPPPSARLEGKPLSLRGWKPEKEDDSSNT